MRSIGLTVLGGLAVAVLTPAIRAGEGGSCTGCTGGGCRPRCQASWEEKKTKKTVYEMRCEYACARGRDSWHAPEPECRCRPPCGSVYVKKRLYKAEGKETVERVPQYEVDMVPEGHPGCTGSCGGRQETWGPLGLLPLFQHR
jgi:hypothetical protein